MNQKVLLPTAITLRDDTLSVLLQITVDDLINASEAAPERERGRPKKLTPQDERLFRMLLDIGTSVEDVCAALQIGRASYFRYKARLAQ